MPETLSADAVRAELRNQLQRDGQRPADWARDHGFSDAFVSAVLNGHKAPSTRMCEALGFRKVKEASYVKETAQ